MPGPDDKPNAEKGRSHNMDLELDIYLALMFGENSDDSESEETEDDE